jgi:hypothetical protein
MKNLVLLFIIAFLVNVYAEEKYIELEGNKYEMENICSALQKIDYNAESFARYYKFIFNSKHNVFENYDIVGNHNIVIKTNLYLIEINNSPIDFILAEYKPKILKNKKTIGIILNEDEMKKLYESDSAKVIFDSSIFTYNYTKDKSNIYAFQRLQPIISLSLKKDDFNYELKKCTEKYNEYIKEHNEYHNKPINRVKKFFNL